jgi:hypothetical protein
VCSTSTQIEQVFVIFGVVDTAQQNCLNSDSITVKVFIHNNLSKLGADIQHLSMLLHYIPIFLDLRLRMMIIFLTVYVYKLEEDNDTNWNCVC